jgi:hypothetical protein
VSDNQSNEYLSKKEVMERLGAMWAIIDVMAARKACLEEIPDDARVVELISRAIRQVDELPALDPEELVREMAPLMEELAATMREPERPRQISDEPDPRSEDSLEQMKQTVDDLEEKVRGISANLVTAIDRADKAETRADELRGQIAQERLAWKVQGCEPITDDLWLRTGRERFFLDLSKPRETGAKLSRWLHSYLEAEPGPCIHLAGETLLLIHPSGAQLRPGRRKLEARPKENLKEQILSWLAAWEIYTKEKAAREEDLCDE